MREKTEPTFLFWIALAYVMEFIASMIWFQCSIGLLRLLLWATIQAFSYQLHLFCAKNRIWEGSKIIVGAMSLLFVLLFLKNWIFGVAEFGKLLSQLILRVGYQMVLLYCTKKFG